MSYGAEPTPMWAQAATYIDRILRGKKAGRPAGASADQGNLKTAKAFGAAGSPQQAAVPRDAAAASGPAQNANLLLGQRHP
jgi:hypothetical protein